MSEEPFVCAVAFYKMMICGCVTFGKQRERARESGILLEEIKRRLRAIDHNPCLFVYHEADVIIILAIGIYGELS